MSTKRLPDRESGSKLIYNVYTVENPSQNFSVYWLMLLPQLPSTIRYISATPFYTKTEPIPVGIVRWLTRHRVPRRTAINIQALLDVIALRRIRRGSIGRGDPASAHSVVALNAPGLGAVILACASKTAGASD
jgi:hypothetical protein